jgi:hypothetical protein
VVLDKTTDAEIDALYDKVDDMLRAGLFDDVDRLLASIDVERLTITMMLAHATITFAANDRLREYFPYVARVRVRLMQVDPERTDDLLRGLEERCSPFAQVLGQVLAPNVGR